MARLIASFFGTGLILGKLRASDTGAGTLGALVALPMSVALGDAMGWPSQLVAAVATVAVGLWATQSLAEDSDPGWIVIDEVGGVVVATVGLTIGPALVAFVVFRIADIAKGRFPGVRQAEDLPGAWGVMADDLVAAAYGLVAGHLAQIAIG
jgi:phosphatidylglycerophosphatase A